MSAPGRPAGAPGRLRLAGGGGGGYIGGSSACPWSRNAVRTEIEAVVEGIRASLLRLRRHL
jgi:hypothetical protein